jgi:filamentous hemagglutinin family protein
MYEEHHDPPNYTGLEGFVMRGKVVTAGEPRISFLVIILLVLSLVPFSSSSLSSADAAPPTAISPTSGTGSLSTVVPPTLPTSNLCTANCVITGGTRPGGGTNLFHSFGQFSVGPGDIANFLNAGSVDLNGLPLGSGLPTSNILARVTGSSGNNPTLSSIYGTIQTTNFPGANLFLMNPAGFLFGPNATVNVAGMVAFTSADYLQLREPNGSNAGIFHADPAQASILTNAPVAAFGFLGSNPGAITVQGSQFSVTDGQSISLVGGNIAIQSDTLNDGTVQPAHLSAPGGQINLASLASPGEVSASNFLPEPGMTMTRGNITLSQGTTVDVSGDAAGTIRIRAGQFELVNSVLNADTGNAKGAETAIDIHLTGNLLISSDSVPAMTARSFGDGNAGEVSVVSAKMQTVSTLPEFVSLIDTHTEGAGNGGNVTLNTTGDLTVMGNHGGFDFFIMSGTAGAGDGGNVTIHADTVHLQEARIDTGDAILGGGGSGGDVTFTGGDMIFDFVSIVTDSHNAIGGNILLNGRDITITNESSIGPLSLFGQSTVTINARNFALEDRSIIFNQTTLGTGGGITITSENAEFSNGSRVFSQTSGDADAGFIKLVATGLVTFADTFDGPPVPRSGLFTQSLGDPDLGTHGNAGAIDVSVGSLTITGGARIDSSTQTNGKGGAITITATDGVSITGERPLGATPESRASGIYTRSVGSELCAGPCGNAGSVTISSGSLNLGDGGTINSNTTNNGVGGNITVNAANTITVSGTMIDGTPSGIFSRTIGPESDAGAGGNIALTAGQSVTISNGATVSASSTGPGNTGNIQIDAGNQFAMINGKVTTEANQASGGTIKITTSPSGTVQLTNSTISASVLDGTGGGGSVNIDPQFVILQNSQILAQATQGPGGNIFITTNLLLPDANSVIDASSQFGLNGTVTIQSPNAPASGKIQPLGKTPLPATSLLTQRCAALAGGEFSSFTVAGRDSLPTEPGSWLASPMATLDAGMGRGGKAEGVKAEGERPDAPILSLRQIAPAGFLTQAFALDWSAGCQS